MSSLINCIDQGLTACEIRRRILRRFRRLRFIIMALIDILVDDPTFIELKHELMNNPTLENFIKFVRYIRNFFNRENRLFDNINFYFDANIVFADDNNVPIIMFDLIKPLNCNLIDTLNDLPRKKLVELFERFRNKNQTITPPERLNDVVCVVEKKCKKWVQTDKYFIRYTPGSVSVTFVETSDLFFTTSQQNITPVLNSNQNAFIIALTGTGATSCYSGGRPNPPQPDVCRGGPSSAFISAIVRNQFTTNNTVYELVDFNVSITSDTQIILSYVVRNTNQTIKVILRTNAPLQVIPGVPTEVGYYFITYEPSSASQFSNLIFYSLLATNGALGGFVDGNGTTVGGPSSGSGIDTTGAFFDPATNTYVFPNGPYANPPLVNLTLPGSLNVVTSQGGGKTVPSSGYGSGGGTSPPQWIVDGVNLAPEIIKGRPGYCQILSTYIE